MKSEDKLVSVVITTHNRVELLKKAIISVKNQSYKNMECFIIDDASDMDIEQEIQPLLDERFQLIKIGKKESKGGNHARNIGISHCNGSYVAFLDDDDIWLENKLEEQVAYMENHSEVGVVYCSRIFCYNSIWREVELIDSNNQGDCSKRIFNYNNATTSSIMVKRELLLDNLFDEELQFWQEYDLLIRLCQITQVGYVDKPLVEYLINYNDSNRKTNKYDEWLNAVEYINKKYAEEISCLSNNEKKLRELLVCYDACNRLFASGRKNERRPIYKKMFLLTKDPKHLIKYIFNFDHSDKVCYKMRKINVDDHKDLYIL